MKIEKIDKWLDDKYGISYTELVKIKEYLSEENERIKKMNMHEHKYGSDMEGKYLIEKAKNDKAVEYIKEHEYDIRNNFDYYVKGSKLLNILRGKDNE